MDKLKLKSQFKENKTIIIILVLIVLLFVFYKFFGKEIEPLISITKSTHTEGEKIVGQELLDELERLRTLNRINMNFFNDPVFRSLKDISVDVAPQPIGRSNPFIPTGSGI